MKAYWIKLCTLLIDLLTNSKFAAVLNHKMLQLLLKGRYIVSTGQRGCFLIDCSCLGTTLTAGLSMLEKGQHQRKVLKGLLQNLFVLSQGHNLEAYLSNTIQAVYLSPDVLCKAFPGLSSDVTHSKHIIFYGSKGDK